MITIRKAQKDDVTYLTKLYNGANELFTETERSDGTDDIFEKIVEEDIVYLLLEEDIPTAFMAYHEYEEYIALTALYVDYRYQRRGYGKILLSYFESLNLYLEKYYIVKSLVNAPWAVNFYKKNGYKEWSEDMNLKGITFEPWSYVLYKVPQQGNTGTCKCGCN